MSDEIEDLNDRYPGAGNFRFGDNKALCQELIALVRAGKKIATCGALRDFEDDPGSMPVPGRCDIAMTWGGSPALVIRTLSVERVRFCDVTEEMALAEGEDDDLAGWQAGHRAYFERNGGWAPDMMLVFERFEMVEDLDGRAL